MTSQALAGLRVLECGDFVAAPYAAMLMGHLGADIVKVEPPTGDSNRLRGPYAGGAADAETGALHLFLDQAKRSIVLDLERADARDELRLLAAGADVLIASGPPAVLEGRCLTFAALQDAAPQLIV